MRTMLGRKPTPTGQKDFHLSVGRSNSPQNLELRLDLGLGRTLLFKCWIRKAL